jgi:hypothetical protein
VAWLEPKIWSSQIFAALIEQLLGGKEEQAAGEKSCEEFLVCLPV